jgi:hypothetical protein
MTIVEIGDDGSLDIRAKFLGNPKPHTKFEVEVSRDRIVIRPVVENASISHPAQASDTGQGSAQGG